MSGLVWTPSRDAVLAQFAAEGRSAREASKALGVTRNAVIGRAYRTGVRFSPPRPQRQERPKRPPIPRGRKPGRAAVPVEELLARYKAGEATASIAHDYGITKSYVWSLATLHGAARTKRDTRRRSDEFVLAVLTRLAAEGSYRNTAKAFGISESVISLWRQQRPVLLAKAEAEGRLIRQRREAEAARAAQEARDRREKLLRELTERNERVLASLPRRYAAMCRAYATLGTLQAAGDAIGVTRERIRQVVKMAEARGFVRPKLVAAA
jgi:transposase